jgi:MFS transporter, OFA family, oxalate/formate antiporter
MNQLNTLDDVPVKNLGWQVTFAGLGINLALGVLYSWSIISGAIDEAGWGWTQTQMSLPYSVACLVFCLIMVPAGRMQDKMGPRLVASLGGLLVGIGMIAASFTKTPIGYIIGFGVLAGAGIGFGYASATPPAVKWFPPAKTGMIAGIVVSGFGLASVYVAPLARWLASSYNLKTMMMVLGIGFLFIVTGLAQFLKPPHPAFQLIKGLGRAGAHKKELDAHQETLEFTPKEMLSSITFYMLWFMYACGAGAGLMIISVAKTLSKTGVVSTESDTEKTGAGVAAVVSLAIGNGVGRILAGMLSDKLGRKVTLFLFFMMQAVMVILLALAGREGSELGTATFFIVVSALVGANYGANLALFPSITKDYYGAKNFGVNYGLVFTSWGIGGFLLALLAAQVYDKQQSFAFALYCSAALLIAAAALTFAVKPPRKPKPV